MYSRKKMMCLLFLVVMCLSGCRESASKEQVKVIQNTPLQATAKPYDKKDLFSEKHGSADKLSGNIVVVSIFVNDIATKWENTDDMDCALKYLGIAAEWLEAEASKYGSNAKFLYDWRENKDFFSFAQMDADLMNEDDERDIVLWEYIANNVDFEKLVNKYQADNIVFMVFLNTPFSQLATSNTRSYYEGMKYPYEMCFIYNMVNGEQQCPAVYAHEILHTFGAPDLYSVDDNGDNYGVTKKFTKYLAREKSNDIMFTTYDAETDEAYYDWISNEFSELDAYYVGLTDRSILAEKWGLDKSQHSS